MKTPMWLVALALMAVALPSIAHAKPVTTEDLVKAQENAGEWLTYGRDYRNWRYSPLSEITPDNAAKLSPVWTMSTGGQFGGLESTPLFRDGVLYFSADYARVFAVDAKSGNIVWFYEPEYEQGLTAMLCCGPIHRGLALKDDMVFVARLDAKLVALNRADGKVVWEAKIDEWKNGVTTNSAPLVVKDHVIIGVSGGEYGVRGYLKSFNAKTGALEWQTFTVPAPGEPGSETWPKDDTWKSGGGPTWLTGSYDAETNTLYWGVGNPAPWPSEAHAGDNLWTESMLAFDPGHRQDEVGLSVHAKRPLGLRRHGDPDPGRRADRWSGSQAGGRFQPQWLLLRDRPHEWAIRLCLSARRRHQLDERA